jgi:hypothetical protein
LDGGQIERWRKLNCGSVFAATNIDPWKATTHSAAYRGLWLLVDAAGQKSTVDHKGLAGYERCAVGG